MDLIEGVLGKKGAKSKLTFQMGKKNIEMVETILTDDLPKDFSIQFETKGMTNIVKSTFEVVAPDVTKLISYNEFNTSGFMKIMAWLKPRAFKKQSMIYMTHFKEYVETGKSVLD